MEIITVVDEKDNVVGKAEKIEVHRKGILHRAFSIFVFNSKKELLLQRRALHKYHSPGLWSNTCCGHPRFGEKLTNAVHRRLKEEFGFDCKLKEIFSFHYRAEFDNGLIENEIDHVFIGIADVVPKPNKNEIAEWKWISLDDLKKDIAENPEKYTFWFRHIIEKYCNKLEKFLKANQ
ncbi:MAG: isopentenyl-diphosphate Delta-isomerase [Candidatus Diapherotrites archaeon]|nr:isopentenyl-diphosphate Delta-isomerase [Candidatus Diapherotrites archaeon]